MKVLVKLTVMAFLVVATSPLMAMADNSLETLVSFKDLEPGKVQLAYYGKNPEKVHVQIYNEENKQVFKETIVSKKGIRKPYNLQQLPYGEYKIEVRVADETTVHKVKHEAPRYPGQVKLQAAAFGEDKVKMLVMGPNYKRFKLRIYDEHNELLYQYDIRQKDNFGRVLNLKGSKAKSVRLVLSNNREILQRTTVNL